MAIENEIKEFRSRNHPGHRSASYVFSTRMARPLAACMLPVMIIGLSGILQGYSVLPLMAFGFPAAILIAGVWTRIRIGDEIVELHFRNQDLALRGILSAADPENELRWLRILDIQHETNSVRITLGHEFYHIQLSDWPEREHLISHLESAARVHAAAKAG